MIAAVPLLGSLASTRPIEEIAGPQVFERHAIGFQHIKMTPAAGYRWHFKDYELAAFRASVIREEEEALRHRAKERRRLLRPRPQFVPQPIQKVEFIKEY